jgi:hypothetical protein
LLRLERYAEALKSGERKSLRARGSGYGREEEEEFAEEEDEDSPSY